MKAIIEKRYGTFMLVTNLHHRIIFADKDKDEVISYARNYGYVVTKKNEDWYNQIDR